jgi:hypothetical protein
MERIGITAVCALRVGAVGIRLARHLALRWGAGGPRDPLLTLGRSRSHSTAQGTYLNADGSVNPTMGPESAPTSLGDNAVPVPSIDDVVRDLATKQARLSQYIETCLERGVAVPELTRLFTLHGQNSSRLGRLLRDRLVLSGEAGDVVAEAIALALDDLEQELEVSQ